VSDELPNILRKPLIFGNVEQIKALNDLEKESNLCENCTGEGMVECPACKGSGQKKQ